MPRKIDWENEVGRRLRLRDLHLFFTVAEHGSMAKAASRLGISQPAVSEVVSGLEHSLGVRLFDRSPRGIELTVYGQALLRRSEAVFDELRQGIRDIECLVDQSAGEVRIGCPESIAASILPAITECMVQRYPGIVLHVTQVGTSTTEFPELRERKFDLVIARVTPLIQTGWDDLQLETLFHDKLVLATSSRSEWATRTSDLAELVNAKWILTPRGTMNNVLVAELFQAHGLAMPKINVMTFSVHLRTHLLATGDFITAMPLSTLRLSAERFQLKALPVDLPILPWPVAIVTLKNRTLSAVVERFIECVREVTRPIVDKEAAAPRKPNPKVS
jgi:DNA-binding transcriptional LysR family regulator